MPHIRPFHGLLYNPEKIKDMAKVLTEPYDVISPAQQKAYYNTHPYNIIRLILGRHYPQDTRQNNQYTRANKSFLEWQRRNILLRDKKESIYIYSQSFFHGVGKYKNTFLTTENRPRVIAKQFSCNSRRKVRTGFIVLLKLEDFTKNTILPHESTFLQPVEDRLELLKATRANLSPIFALFSDPQKKTNKLLNRYKREHPPYLAVEKDRVTHRLWRLTDRREIAAIQKLLKDEQVFIADGHHRYEAALNFKAQMQKRKRSPSSSSSFNYVMTYLVPADDPGLTILPTHRVLKNLSCFNQEEIIASLTKIFYVQGFSSSERLFAYMLKGHSASCIFGVYLGKKKFLGLRLKDKRTLNEFAEERHGAHKNLDVDVLHDIIIKRILNPGCLEKDINYTRDAQEAMQLVDRNRYQLAFFLRAVTVKEVKKAACAGTRMPHKSTYFYPKLLSGLVINTLY